MARPEHHHGGGLDSNTTRDAVMSAMTRLLCLRFQADREMLALLAIADRGAGQR